MPEINVLALDVGEERVGVALVRAEVRVSVLLTTLKRKDPDFWDELLKTVAVHDVQRIVVGLPRGLDGQETAQTRSTQAFGAELTEHLTLPVDWQDEALTSIKAEAVLRGSGKPYQKADIDALAASFILADYLEMEHSR